MSTGTIARDTFGVFGTTAVLLMTGRDISEARAMADETLADVDLACSRFRPDSELSRLNAAGGKPIAISQTLAALRAAELTDGSVDPTCGAALVALGYDRDFTEVLAAGASGGSSPQRAAARGTWASAPADPAGLREDAGPVRGWRCVHLDQQSRGADAIGWLSGLGLPARLVGQDGTVVTTAGWPADRDDGDAP